MRLLGLDISITRAKAAVPATTVPTGWDWNFGTPFWSSTLGGLPLVQEPFTGAWQKNLEARPDSVLANFAVYSCISLIASDISKLRLRLMQEDLTTGISKEVASAAFTPVLTKPNHYQNRIKFIESWIISKYARGNTYILKERDARNVVVAMYVLDPGRVKPLVAENGEVFYSLGSDVLAGVPNEQGGVVVPASEIIHDVMVPLFHPLCGVSPIYACALAAIQGINIQTASTKFFNNGSNPGGILSAPGQISDPTAKRLKEYWEQNFTGANIGKVAVLGDGLKYEQMHVTAQDSQLIEQLKWSAETVCGCFHVPPYMIGIGPMPAYNNIEALNQQYYSQCLQAPMESIELCTDEGLGLPEAGYETEFDLDDLLRMDTSTKVEATKNSINAGFMSPNEGRARFNLPPVAGGATPYLQQQYYSLEALSKRDKAGPPPPTPPVGGNTPPAPGGPASPPAPPPAPKEAANAASAIAADIWRRARTIRAAA